MAEVTTNRLDSIAKTIQVVSVVVGVVLSIFSFNATRQQEASARAIEEANRKMAIQKYEDERRDSAERQKIEAAKPFLVLRQKAYLETVQCAAIIANAESNSAEMIKAKKRFRQLYVAELSMVEDMAVEAKMVNLAKAVCPELLYPTPAQSAALDLSHALRDSLAASWKVDKEMVGNSHR